jgi:hypothetical protein
MAISMKKLEVFEILDKVSSAKTRKDKIDILQKNNIMPIRDVLRGTFDPNIQWNLPSGDVPYTPNKEESYPSTLLKQHMKFKYFVRGLRESENLNSIKREKMFIEICESVHPEDARILVSMINKKPPVKGLTEKLVKEAYPDLIPT